EGRGAAPIAAPALVAADRPVESWIVPAGGRAGDFRANQVARAVAPGSAPSDAALAPFYRTHGRTYSVYFDVLTASQFDARVASLAAEAERQRRVESASVAFVQPGDTAAESTFNYRSEPADRAVT